MKPPGEDPRWAREQARHAREQARHERWQERHQAMHERRQAMHERWMRRHEKWHQHHHHHHRDVPTRLRRRIFRWFGATIVISGLITILLGKLLSVNNGWADGVQRAQQFATGELARVWDDPAARDGLIDRVSRSFDGFGRGSSVRAACTPWSR